ncbi:MAG TPA: Ig-like domain-containing protein [Fibrobacteria bacterium]|nr:Ig-like domain-containing protein [Fibrobacteria bacterium]
MAIASFAPTAANPFFAATQAVQITDGRPTLAANGGTNTKIDYALIQSGVPTAGRPSVRQVAPGMGAGDVSRSAAVTAEVNLPNGPLNFNTVNGANVRLFRSADNLLIPAQVNTSGGGDVIVLQPNTPLDANRGCRFEVSQGVQDDQGNPFLPFSSHFTTGTALGFPLTSQIFDRVSLGAAGTLTGHILRFNLNPDGTVQTPVVITSLRQLNGNQDRAIIGMAFDPASTAAAPLLWVSNNAPTLENPVDWSGKITRLGGSNLSQAQDYVRGLPRSTKDHMTNGLAFAPGAPVTLYATGVRNAYDLVWHSNGSLYRAGNSSAAWGYAPKTPSPLPAACNNRIDGPYTGPQVAEIMNNPPAQPDFLYRILPGKYYGHPNPRRCEWVLNGGNPTAGTDTLQDALYPVGTLPDRNRHKPFVLGMHFSPDGTLEYKHSGSLQHKLLVTRSSAGKDILAISLDSGTKEAEFTKEERPPPLASRGPSTPC